MNAEIICRANYRNYDQTGCVPGLCPSATFSFDEGWTCERKTAAMHADGERCEECAHNRPDGCDCAESDCPPRRCPDCGGTRRVRLGPAHGGPGVCGHPFHRHTPVVWIVAYECGDQASCDASGFFWRPELLDAIRVYERLLDEFDDVTRYFVEYYPDSPYVSTPGDRARVTAEIEDWLWSVLPDDRPVAERSDDA